MVSKHRLQISVLKFKSEFIRLVALEFFLRQFEIF